MLQAPTWSFRNASAKVRNQPVVTKNGLSKPSRSKSGLKLRSNFPKHVIMIYHKYFSVFLWLFMHFPGTSSYEKSLRSFVYVPIFFVHAGIVVLMFVPNGPVPHSFSGKVELTRSVREQMDEKLFISRQSWPFSFGYNIIKLRFFNCSLNWRANSYVSRERKGSRRRNQSIIVSS